MGQQIRSQANDVKNTDFAQWVSPCIGQCLWSGGACLELFIIEKNDLASEVGSSLTKTAQEIR